MVSLMRPGSSFAQGVSNRAPGRTARSAWREDRGSRRSRACMRSS